MAERAAVPKSLNWHPVSGRWFLDSDGSHLTVGLYRRGEDWRNLALVVVLPLRVIPIFVAYHGRDETEKLYWAIEAFERRHKVMAIEILTRMFAESRIDWSGSMVNAVTNRIEKLTESSEPSVESLNGRVSLAWFSNPQRPWSPLELLGLQNQ